MKYYYTDDSWLFWFMIWNALCELLTARGKRMDLFHNNISPSGEQPGHRKLPHEL